MHMGVFENGEKTPKNGHPSRDLCCKHLDWILLYDHIFKETRFYDITMCFGILLFLP